MDTPPDEAGVPVTQLLTALARLGGSDLHLMAGQRPQVRLNGQLIKLEQFPKLAPTDIRSMVYNALPQKLRERFEQDLELDT